MKTLNAFLALTLLAALAVPCLGQEGTPPAAPSDLNVVEVGPWNNPYVQLAWTDNSSDELYFVVQRCHDAACDSPTSIFDVPTDTTGFGDYDVLQQTYYTYRVYATNQYGISELSNVVGVTTEAIPPVPPPPTNLVATAVTQTQIDLTWTSSGGESYIAIHLCPDADCSTSTALRYIDANPTTFSLGFLSPGRTYYIRLAALDVAGRSEGYSNVAVASTPPVPGPPAAPSNLVAYVISATQIQLSWMDNANNETHFEIERCSDSGCTNFVRTATSDRVPISYTDSGLTPNTTYQYRVRAANADGYSAYTGTVTTTTPDVPPAAPSGLRAAVVGMHIQLNWNDNSNNEFDFEIERCAGLAAACGDSTLNTSMVVAAGATSLRDSTTKRRTTYTYRIRARGIAGSSPWSNLATVSTK